MRVVTTNTSGRVRRWSVVLATLTAWFVGGCGALALTVAFTVFDDSCPAYDDEGPMAAPASAYGRIMCEPLASPALSPMAEVPIPPILLGTWVLASIGAAWMLHRQLRRDPGRHVAALLAGLLLIQPLLVLAAQHTLPRDCLTGRTAAGECTRDRELR